jgi:hypothetical protein
MENRLPIIYLVDSAGVFTATGRNPQTKNILDGFLEIMPQMSSMGITKFQQ